MKMRVKALFVLYFCILAQKVIMRLSLFFILSTFYISAQGTFSCGYNHSTEPSLCDFVANKTYISNQMVVDKINTMVNSIALPQNFILVECENINNAFAYVKNGTRYIIIDDQWIRSIEGNNWFITGILAHEIGHHLCGHTISNGYVSLEDRRKRELEADKFAGFILKAIGATQDQSLIAINSIVPVDFDDSRSTHPTKSKRIEAIKKGYNNSNSELKTNTISQLSSAKTAESYFNDAMAIVKEPSYEVNQQTLERSIVPCKKALELNSNFLDAYFHLACIYQALGTKLDQYRKYYYNLAFENYRKALSIDASSSGVYNNAGMLYAQYGYDYSDYSSYQNAISCYNASIRLEPDNSSAYLNRGIAYLNIGYQFRQPTLPTACNDFYKSCSLGESRGCDQYNRACGRR